MLTKLTVEIGKFTRSYDAVQLLSLLQQAVPGFKKPAGEGSLADPWRPKAPNEWWYCAKEKPKVTGSQRDIDRFWTDSTNLAWLGIGGRYISVNPGSFYASSHGALPTTFPVTPAPKAPPTVEHKELAYSAIYSKISAEGGGRVDDAGTARAIRSLLKGDAAGGSTVLPLLSTVLFVSEVARNHTAFHTNLMLLDLVEKRIAISGSTPFKYDMKTALWDTQIIDSSMALERLKAQRGSYADRQAEHAKIHAAKGPLDELNQPVTPGPSPEGELPGGVAPMSHKASAWGSAYDLEGKGKYTGVNPQNTRPFPKPGTPLTLVRQKEATILIRWLTQALGAKPNVKATALIDAVSLQTSGVYDQVEKLSTGATGVDQGMGLILELLQERVDTFDCLL
jgi:hypothetical protein